MANFVLVVDPDKERRSRFVCAIEPVIRPVDGLSVDRCSVGDFEVIWAAAQNAPVTSDVDLEGAAILWGEALTGQGVEQCDAGVMRSKWYKDLDNPTLVYDGFYAAAIYRCDIGLAVSADILGYFPIYYFSTGDVLLVGSSPELFRYHPLFQMEINTQGLVGILLTNGLLDGQTLWRHVKRLSPGHLLRWQAGTMPTEIEQYQIPVSSRYFDLPFSAHIELLDETLKRAIARHVSKTDQTYALLLSGGLDSRLLGGYLHEQNVGVKALTYGWPTDIEMQCAHRVAQTLGFEHHTMQLPFDRYAELAGLSAKWEQLAVGFSSIFNWDVHTHLRLLASRVVTGYSLDAVIGTGWIHPAYCSETKRISYDKHFSHVNTWGISPDLLQGLLRHDVFGDQVNERVDQVRKVYESYRGFEFQRVWRFNLHHRQRFHVGGGAWSLSFGAWPVVPVLDRNVLEVAGAVPAAIIAERKGEIDLLCKRFPELAHLPLDAGASVAIPIVPRLRQRMAWYMRKNLEPVISTLKQLVGYREIERRYVYRVLGFSETGWQSVRYEAEPYRERLLPLFVKDALDQYLHPPDVNMQFENIFDGPSGRKLLLGLMFFAHDHL